MIIVIFITITTIIVVTIAIQGPERSSSLRGASAPASSAAMAGSSASK